MFGCSSAPRSPQWPAPSTVGSVWQRMIRRFSDVPGWKGLLYGVLMLPWGIVSFTVVVTLWTVAWSLAVFPLVGWWLPRLGRQLPPHRVGARRHRASAAASSAGCSWPRCPASCTRSRPWTWRWHGRCSPRTRRRCCSSGSTSSTESRDAAHGVRGAGAAPHRARPARRRAAAAGQRGHEPRHGEGPPGEDDGEDASVEDAKAYELVSRGPRRGQAGDRRAARPGAGHPPGGAHRSRARRRGVGARRPLPGAGHRGQPAARAGCPPPSRPPPTSWSPRRSPTSPSTVGARQGSVRMTDRGATLVVEIHDDGRRRRASPAPAAGCTACATGCAASTARCASPARRAARPH